MPRVNPCTVTGPASISIERPEEVWGLVAVDDPRPTAAQCG